MIVIKLQGGLGNQMFQYASARSLTKKSIYIDLEFLDIQNISSESFTSRNYELDIFDNCRIKILSKKQRKLLFDRRLRFDVFRKLFFCNIFIIKQNENEFISIDKNHSNIYLDGYFQSEKYFKSNRNRLIREFSFPELDDKNSVIKDKILTDDNSVGIHIRRGDYLKKQIMEYHGILPLSYYLKSIEDLKGQFDNLTFYFFSDDIDFIKCNFNDINGKNIIEGNLEKDSWKDMLLMKSCKHHIIANSSFSWWGAWLSERNGITYAPTKWFNSERAKFNIDDIVPHNWKLINYE